MEVLKNKFVLIAAASSVALGLGYYFISRQKSEKTSRPILRNYETYESLEKEYNQIFSKRVGRFQLQQGLSKQQIRVVFFYLAVVAFNKIKQFEESNLKKISQAKGKTFDQLALTLLTSLKKQDALNKQWLKQKQDIINFLNIKPEDYPSEETIESMMYDFFYKNITTEDYELAKESINQKIDFIRTQDQQIINNFNKLTLSWKHQDFQYVPFILNLIVTEAVESKNRSLSEKSIDINWITKKYAEKLKVQLLAWSTIISELLKKLNPRLSNA